MKILKIAEAIRHCEEKSCGNSQCSQEHKQLAEWLRKLQRYEEALKEIVDSSPTWSAAESYTNSIKIAVKALKE